MCDLCVTGVTVVKLSGVPCCPETQMGVLSWICTFLHCWPLSEYAASTVAGNWQLFAQMSAFELGSPSVGPDFRGTFGNLIQLSDSSKSRRCLTDDTASCGECSNLSTRPLGLNETPQSSIDSPVLLSGNCLDMLAWRHFGNRGFPKARAENPAAGNSVVAFLDLSLCEVRVMTVGGEQNPTTEWWDTVLAWSGGNAFALGVALTHNTTVWNECYHVITTQVTTVRQLTDGQSTFIFNSDHVWPVVLLLQ